MSGLIAIVPRRILDRWDQIAATQLFALAPLLASENEQLRSNVEFYQDSAQMWQDIADRERDGLSIGLTVEGRIVTVGRNPGVTIDDDPEYARGACG